MPRLRTLISVFLVSFAGFALWSMSARVLLPHLPQPRLADGPVQFDQARGRIWDGSLRWRWHERAGRLDWNLDWRGLSPGVQLSLTGRGLDIAGWLGGGPGQLRLTDWRLDLPVSLIGRFVERGSAGGRVTGRLRQLVWRDGAIDALSGQLRWSGGHVRWPPDGQADLPPLEGRLFRQAGKARAEVTDPDGRRLASARLVDGQLRLRVYRAWPMLLGVSQGGSASDVVFEVSRPLPGAGQGSGQ